MNSKRTAIASLCMVLLVGFLLGVIIDRYLLDDHNRPPFERRRSHDFFARLSVDLQLNDLQKEQLRILLEATKAKHDSLRKTTGPQFRRIQEEFQQEFKKALDPDQRKKFEKITKRDRPRG